MVEVSTRREVVYWEIVFYSTLNAINDVLIPSHLSDKVRNPCDFGYSFVYL